MHEFRPRPAIARLALVLAAQLFVAAWITNLAVSLVELSILRRAGLESWLVYATPWDGVRERLAVRTLPRPEDDSFTIWIYPPPAPGDEALAERALRADAEHMRRGGWFGAGAVVVALLVVYLWPGGPSLAARMFGYVLAAVLATFGTTRLAAYEMLYPSGLWYELPAAAMVGALSLLVGIGVAIAAVRRLLTLLGNVFEVRRFVVREGLVMLLVVPALAIGAVSLFATHTHVGAACALFLAGGAAVAALPPVPSRFEQLTRVELHSAAAPFVIAAVLLGASGVRVLTLRPGRIRYEPWPAVRVGIHLHWPLSNESHASPPRPRHPASPHR